MSEEKAKCEKCGDEIKSDNVVAYSKKHYENHVYCYDCQQKMKDNPDWEYEPPKKEEDSQKKGTLGAYSGDDVSNSDSEEIDDIDAIGTENAAEINAELNDEFTALRDKMSAGHVEQLYEWIKSEYDVGTFDELSIEKKRAVLEQTHHLLQQKEAEKVADSKDTEVGGAKVVDAEIVVEEKEGKEEEKWDKTVEIDEGAFMFREEEGKLLCRNGVNDNVYELDVSVPSCSCPDFQVNKQKQEYCKHLKAASVAGYLVKELPELPEEVSNALVKLGKTEKARRKEKVKKEAVMALAVMGQEIEIAVQTPVEIIQNEENATKMITDIVGMKPQFSDVIEKFGSIEEVSSDVVISLAQHAGIRFQILNKEIETVRMNLGKVYMAVEMDPGKKKNYSALVDLMPDTDVVIRCKITAVAAWKDKSGNLRVGMGTKEEHLTPYELKDLSRRGANFIETKCESKAFKKSILNALPITHDGLKSKIKQAYGW